MPTPAFQLGTELNNKKIEYKLHQPMWSKYSFDDVDFNIENWTTIKYLNNEGDSLNSDINDIPNNLGGIYMFSIRCPIIYNITDFPVYIGRALLTEHQNLRKRCKEYYTKWSNSTERPKISKMMELWGGDLHLSYLTFSNNESIKEYEKQLINSLLLPFNEKIPDKTIRDAIKAF